MNILEKIKKIPLALGILSVLLIIGIVYAADSYQVNSGAQVTIDEHTVCKKVTNNNSLAIFVPTKTADEWTAFRTNAPEVTYADCIYCQDNDGDGYGVCPNCNIDHGCTYDGDDCCDSDANTYPGQTSFFASTNACGSWDYNCDGSVSKQTSSCGTCTTCSVSGACDKCAGATKSTVNVVCSVTQSCGGTGGTECKFAMCNAACTCGTLRKYSSLNYDYCASYGGVDDPATLVSTGRTCSCR